MPEWDMTFVIGHVPHPYTRTTRRQMYVDPRWRAYCDSRGLLRDDLKKQLALHGWTAYQTGQALSVQIKVFTGKERYNNVDLDNIAKGIIDGMQSVVFPNDAWIDEMYAIRCPSPEGTGQVLVQIKEVSKEWLVMKALNLTAARIREHGILGAIQAAIEEVRNYAKDPP